MVSPALLQARTLLDAITPLHADCGALCAHACCQSLSNEENKETGMFLFPTEEALFVNVPWAKLVDSAWKIGGKPVPLLVCQGFCERGLRPLACRLFPLTLRVRGEGFRVVTDARAWPVCPLMPSGRKGLDKTFVEDVEKAFALLWADPVQQAYLRELDALIALYRSL